MGSTTVAKAGSVSNVNKDLAELTRLSADPVKNLGDINAVLARLATTNLTLKQKRQFDATERGIYDKLSPSQHLDLYLLSAPKGYVTVDVSEIKEIQEAMGTLKTFAKAPLLYLLEIQKLYDQFGDALKKTKAAKDISRRLTATELSFVNSTPLVIPKPQAAEKPEPELKPIAEKTPVPDKGDEVEVEISSAHAEGAVEKEVSSKSASAKTLRTEINLLPREFRLVGTAPKAPDITPTIVLPRMFGPNDVATMSNASKDMFLGYFAPNRNSTAGTTYYAVIMNWLNTTTGQSGDLNATNATDPRWNLVTQLIATDTSGQGGRQQVVDVMNQIRRGNYLEAMNLMPDGSVLKSAILDGVRKICPQMITSIPISVLTMGGDLELFRFKNAKLTLGPHAWVSHVTSQQYQPELKPGTDANGNTIYTLIMKPTGYTGKQMAARLGATGKYHPWDYATLQLDIGALSQYDVVESGDSTGQARLMNMGKTQALIEASFVDASGRTAGYLKLPLYYALRGSFLTPSNSFSLTGAGGLGIGRLKGLGPVMIVADIGGEFKKGSPDYPQPLADLVWRAGVGITPSTAKGESFPMKFYYVQSSGGEPTPLGVKTESTIGGGADVKLFGIRMGTEVRYRKAATISGIPFTGPGNVLVIFNVDVSDFVHRGIYKKER